MCPRPCHLLRALPVGVGPAAAFFKGQTPPAPVLNANRSHGEDHHRRRPKKPAEQDPATPLHNRWHPDIPAVARVKEGELFRVECGPRRPFWFLRVARSSGLSSRRRRHRDCPTSTPSTRRRAPGSPVDVLRHRRDSYTRRCIDWTGGQIKNDDCADDVKNVDLSQVHYLSGPIAVENAQPGDLLKVELSNLGCLEGDEWGFTGTFHKDNGGGFLTDHYPQATKACWDIEGVYCQSRNIPGVRFAGLIHPGLIGTAPSKELLDMWNKREAKLQSELGTATEKTLCSCLATRRLACLPEPTGALLGKLGHFKHARCVEINKYGDTRPGAPRFPHAPSLGPWRPGGATVPGRENGGNCDIKNLSRGCASTCPSSCPARIYRWATCTSARATARSRSAGAIEMSGWLDLKCTVSNSA